MTLVQRIAAAAAVVALVAACGSSTASNPSPGTPVPVSASYFGDWESSYVVAVGLKEGFFKAANLQVTPQQFSSGPPSIAALNSGSLDFAFIGPGPIKLAMKGQAVIIGMNDFSITDYLIARADIHQVADLKGKDILYQPSTVGEVVLDLGLAQAGMSTKDVHLVNIPDPGALVTAFVSGQAAAVAVSAPDSTTVTTHDPSAHILFSDATLYPKLAMPDSWVTSQAMITNHPDTVKRFMWAELKINDWALAHPQEAINDVAAFAKQPASIIEQNAAPANAKLASSTDLVSDFKNGTAQGWYEAIGQVFVVAGRITTVPAANTYLDFGPAIAIAPKLSSSTY